MTPKPDHNIISSTVQTTGVLNECDSEIISNEIPLEAVEPDRRKLKIVWINIGHFTVIHATAAYGLYLSFTSAKLATSIYAIILYQLGMIGITAGAHRLWSHRSYKATWQLRLLLTMLTTLAHQNSVIEWARDHRVHHKYSETDADPHNARRGFFFSHMGWLICRKHSEVKSKGKQIDISDLWEDPFLRFQRKYDYIVMPVGCFVLPLIAPMVLWNETFINVFCINVLRYVFTLHATWLVNSAAHMWGNKPYDKYINPSENLFVSLFANGEGWHNYHHTFPWDYKTAEIGKLNLSLWIINLCAKIGWAYDLKTISKDMIQKRVQRTGDGTHPQYGVWGWGDRDQEKQDFKDVTITNRKDK